MSIKVLVTDRRHPSLDNERRVLEPLGVEVVDKFSATEDELIENGKGVMGMLVSYARVTRRVMQALPDLKIAVKYGVGYDNLDTVAGKELGVYTVNVPDYCMEEVALQALSIVMSGTRFTHFYARDVKDGKWQKDPSSVRTMHRTSAMTAGFMGYGRIARKLADFLKPLVSSLKYYDPYVPAADGLSRVDTVEELFASCDIISVHSPLTDATRGIVGDSILSRARGCTIVNTSRAAVIDRKALIRALDSGTVGFYGADVSWEEPVDMANEENLNLLGRDNVIVTPHMGWYSAEAEQEVRIKAAMEIARVVRGEKPLHVV